MPIRVAVPVMRSILVVIRVMVPMLVAVPVTWLIRVVMAVPVPDRIAMLMAVTVPVGRAGHLIHASIVRDELRFRTSTITRDAHMRNERNNMLVPGSNSPPFAAPLQSDNSKKRSSGR